MPAPVSSTFRFGPFEVNPTSGELLKDGRRIKLQDQPFRLLVVLVEHAGQVVSREEIRSRLWSGDTFVDFDSGLRVAIRKLREALGDSAENPRYIETIPKRGYRLLLPATPAIATGIPNQGAADAPALEPVLTDPLEGTSIAPTRARRNWWTTIAILLLVGLAAAALLLLVLSRGRRAPSGPETVVIADFANTTGDPVFDGALRQGLTVELEQSPFLNLISEQRVQQTLRFMGRPAGTRVTPDIGLEICRRTGSDAVLDGSIASVGTRYVVGLRATDCRTGDLLDEEQVQAQRKEDVLDALDRIAGRFRTRVGESLAAVAQHDVPLAEATTSSLEALKAYSTGWSVTFAEGEAAAVPFFRKAVELDPKFAMAYAALGVMYSTIGEPARAAESAGQAFELRDRVSEKEKFFITAYYDGRVTGNQEKAQQTCETWANAYPREALPHAFLSGFVYPGLGKYDAALREARKTVALGPDDGFAYQNLAYDSLYVERVDQAEAALRAAVERGLDVPYFGVIRYDVAFYKGDRAAMDHAVAAANAKPGAEDWIAQHQAFALAYAGHLAEALRTSERAANLAMQASHAERAALFKTPPALWLALFGDAAAARRAASSALDQADNREVDYGAALALAIAGDSAQAERLVSALEKQFPEDTAVRFSYVPTVRAVLALTRGEPSRAIDALQIAAPYELGTPRSNLQGFFGALYPIYVRGEAYLGARRGREAAAEFQKILAHRGIVSSDPIGALAHLELGRAYVLSGDPAKAKAAYRDFLTLWSGADPQIPILQAARAEYQRLLAVAP